MQNQRRNLTGGRGKYCCVPECGSAQYDRLKNKTNISLFRFPNKEKNPGLYKLWVQEVNKFRRKGGSDGFAINENTRICECHFKNDDISISSCQGIKKLKKDVVPSIFSFRKEKPMPTRKYPRKRVLSPPIKRAAVEQQDSEPVTAQQSSNTFENNEICNECVDKTSQLTVLQQKIELLEKEKENLRNENLDLKVINEDIKKRLFCYENIAENVDLFKSSTGVEVEKFSILYRFLNPGDFCENVKLYDPSKKVPDTMKEDPLSSPGFKTPDAKPGTRPKLNAKNQLFLFLTWLRLGYTLKHASWLFNLPLSTISRYIITWANFLYFKLGCVPIWPSRNQINDTMPECFRKTYPSTKVIIDCTELFCQRPSSLTVQSSLFSNYKHHVTYKGLVGVAPSGAVTFISELYQGSISDVEIVRRSGILQKELWEAGDSVMADRGFTISELLKPMGVTLNIPAFLKGRDQLGHEEIMESQTIAAVRIHVERAIERIKRFRQIRNEVPLTLHGSINQIWTVCCLLCNFMPPLIKQ